MEYKDPMQELLSSLEQIVFKEAYPAASPTKKATAFTEFDQLLQDSGLQADEFAHAMGVSVAMVREWQSRREKPSSTELNLMKLVQASASLNKRIA